MKKNPISLGTVIEQVMASLGQGRTFHGWRVVALWPEIVGPEIAKYTRAVRFSAGTLTVVVEKDSWRQELEMQREHILCAIRSRPGGEAVEKIVLCGGSFMENSNE